MDFAPQNPLAGPPPAPRRGRAGRDAPDGHYGAYAQEDREERRADLQLVRRWAMRMTRKVVEQTLGPEPDPALPDATSDEPAEPGTVTPEAALMFTRCATVVRLLVALEEKLDAEAWKREYGGPSGTRRKTIKNPRKDMLKRICERSVHTNAEPRQVHRLLTELQERLEDPDLDDRLAGEERMADVATAVCEELGIEPHLRPFTDIELDYKIEIDRSHWGDLPKLPKGVVGMPGIPSLYEMREKAAGRPWPPKLGTGPP